MKVVNLRVYVADSFNPVVAACFSDYVAGAVELVPDADQRLVPDPDTFELAPAANGRAVRKALGL